MKAVGYIRRSKKSEDNTVSLTDQHSHIRRYCENEHLELEQVLPHDGVSGGKRKRFIELKALIQKHEAGAVVFYNLDRLARDAAGLDDFLMWCAAEGIVIHETTSGVIDTKKAISKFVNRVRGAVDELYRDIIGEKTRHALDFLKSHGRRYSNSPPFGYSHRQIGWNEKRNKPVCELIEDAEEQRALVIINRCARNKLGRYSTYATLRAASYHGRAGLSMIQRLLKKENP